MASLRGREQGLGGHPRGWGRTGVTVGSGWPSAPTLQTAGTQCPFQANPAGLPGQRASELRRAAPLQAGLTGQRSGHSAKLPEDTVVDLQFEDRRGSVGTRERRASFTLMCPPGQALCDAMWASSLEEFTGRLASVAPREACTLCPPPAG